MSIKTDKIYSSSEHNRAYQHSRDNAEENTCARPASHVSWLSAKTWDCWSQPSAQQVNQQCLRVFAATAAPNPALTKSAHHAVASSWRKRSEISKETGSIVQSMDPKDVHCRTSVHLCLWTLRQGRDAPTDLDLSWPSSSHCSAHRLVTQPRGVKGVAIPNNGNTRRIPAGRKVEWPAADGGEHVRTWRPHARRSLHVIQQNMCACHSFLPSALSHGLFWHLSVFLFPLWPSFSFSLALGPVVRSRYVRNG